MAIRILQDEIPRLRISHTCFLTFLFLVLIQIIFAHIAKAAEVCVLTTAEIVSVEGTVEFRKSEGDTWHEAELNTQLCVGDQLRTRRHSRAAVRLMNESVVRLDQRTTLTFSEVEENKPSLFMDLLKGDVCWFSWSPSFCKIEV